MIAGILPHLATFLSENLSPDGDSGRGVDVPLIWGSTINTSDNVVFINNVTGYNELTRNSMYAVYGVTVIMRMYYHQVGQDFAGKNMYDIFEYVDDVINELTTKGRFKTSNGVLPGIVRPASSTGTFPLILQYPVDDPQGLSYIGAEFTLTIPVQVNDC
ncbi:MAG: hypothetical protein ACPG7F_09895 [Aggregatilineales bacterium]